MREWEKRKDLQQPSIIVEDQSPEAVHSRRRLPIWPSGQLKVAFVNEFVSGHKYPSYSPSGQTFRTTIIQEKQILPQPLSLIAPQALSVHARVAVPVYPIRHSTVAVSPFSVAGQL